MNATPDTVYNPKRTFVVQQLKDNILVRGNLPLNDNGEFAYADLDEEIYSQVGNGFHLNQFALIDVSLIDNQGERLDLQCEFNAFGVAEQMPTVWPPVVHGIDIFKPYGKMVAGHFGSLMWMPVQGCDATTCASVEPQQYDFAAIVDQLNSLMQTCHKTVVYFHCMNGHDRAGSVHACYLMKHMGVDRATAMTQPPPKGAMAMKHDWKETYKPLIEWFAGSIGR